MTTFTREQIEQIEVGTTKIAHGDDGRFGEPATVSSIYAKQDDEHGKLFVCGYARFGSTSDISFSVKEGSDFSTRHYRIY